MWVRFGIVEGGMVGDMCSRTFRGVISRGIDTDFIKCSLEKWRLV
jgi:hypothetical protein